MIEQSTTNSTDQLEFHFSGQITQSEYDAVIVPTVESALSKHDRIRVLAVFGQDFSGFDLGVVWADTRMGLSHWRGFDQVAVATDEKWLSVAVRAMAPVFPCPVQVFALSETDDARRWLREALGAVHLTELGGTAVQVQLMGKLDPELIVGAEEGLSAHIREQGGLRLLLDLREFDGWQGLSALGAHFGLVRQHSGQAQRIAIVGDKTWQHMAQRVAGQVLNADIQFFEAAQFDAAKVWITAEM